MANVIANVYLSQSNTDLFYSKLCISKWIPITRLWFFLWSCMDVRVRLWRRLSAEELMLLNCGVGEDSWESLGLQGDPTSPLWRRLAWDFFGRNDTKAETPVLWAPHEKSWLIGKDPDAGRDWGQEEKGTTENEMPDGWLACCNLWGLKDSDMTERLNWTEQP